MVHYFDPPIETGAFLGDLEKRSRKRKRSDDNVLRGESSTADVPNEASEDDMPMDFPHADFKTVPESHKPSKRPYTTQRNQKHRHLNVLYTLLHRCLQEHDYRRARTAFAALLRFEIDGQHVDLRKKGLWGIGAEILLREVFVPGYPEASQRVDLESRDESELGWSAATSGERNSITERYRAVIQYLDRLILQYPRKEHRPNALSAAHLYPIVIAMRIFQAQEESRLAIRANEGAEQKSISDAFSNPSLTPGVTLDASDMSSRAYSAKVLELRRAEEIRAAIVAITASPPYDRLSQLWDLQGNISLWLQDLVMVTNDDAISAKAHLEAARVEFRKARDFQGRVSRPQRQFSGEFNVDASESSS